MHFAACLDENKVWLNDRVYGLLPNLHLSLHLGSHSEFYETSCCLKSWLPISRKILLQISTRKKNEIRNGILNEVQFLSFFFFFFCFFLFFIFFLVKYQEDVHTKDFLTTFKRIKQKEKSILLQFGIIPLIELQDLNFNPLICPITQLAPSHAPDFPRPKQERARTNRGSREGSSSAGALITAYVVCNSVSYMLYIFFFG